MKKDVWIILVFILALGFISRIVFSNTNVFFFDSDEAIVGLMGIDYLKGNFPIYFYGQTYGLAFFEALLVSGGIALFGTTMMAIKIPMLVLWLMGVYFLSRSVHELSSRKLWFTLLFASLIILSPAWLVWSMKARGGYLTSFFFSSLLIWLAIQYRDRIKFGGWLAIGIGLTIIIESQPLWFIPTLLILLFTLFTYNSNMKRSLTYLGTMGIGATAVITLLHFVKSGLRSIWDPPTTNILHQLSEIGSLPSMLGEHLEGNYFLGVGYTTGTKIYALIFSLVWIIGLVVNIRAFVKDRRSTETRWGLVLSSCSIIALSGFLIREEYRYLLPFSGFALFSLALAYHHIQGGMRKAYPYILSIVLMIGLLRLPRFMDYSFVNMSMKTVDKHIENDQELMKDLIRLLEYHNIKYVYTVNASLYYQLNYLTNYEILTITEKDRCRVDWMLDEVYAAYPQKRNEFALVGYNFGFAQTGKIPMVGNKIYYILAPDPPLLQSVRFFKRDN
ncbi:MAG: hypothetical protein LPK80_10215 [Bacteroidota bacterium]|nr:hypothetical protein [Bacteroidota bacterium]MDX5427863.1 hypothetical protein [Bacteroidota bacterium]MDX5446937.1 hypothetical protein [Bacteroidota bacterium]MDX5505739.1 hypothetical protein [Bacteroidota bacterium]